MLTTFVYQKHLMFENEINFAAKIF